MYMYIYVCMYVYIAMCQFTISWRHIIKPYLMIYLRFWDFFWVFWDFSWTRAYFFVLRVWKWLQGTTYQNFIENFQYSPYLMIYLRFWDFLGLLGLKLARGQIFYIEGLKMVARNNISKFHRKISIFTLFNDLS